MEVAQKGTVNVSAQFRERSDLNLNLFRHKATQQMMMDVKVADRWATNSLNIQWSALERKLMVTVGSQ